MCSGGPLLDQVDSFHIKDHSSDVAAFDIMMVSSRGVINKHGVHGASAQDRVHGASAKDRVHGASATMHRAVHNSKPSLPFGREAATVWSRIVQEAEGSYVLLPIWQSPIQELVDEFQASCVLGGDDGRCNVCLPSSLVSEDAVEGLCPSINIDDLVEKSKFGPAIVPAHFLKYIWWPARPLPCSQSCCSVDLDPIGSV